MQTTQCPNCQTRFNVTDPQLSMAGGRVRCGRCTHVFNAREQIEQARRDAALLAESAPRASTLQDFSLELPPEPAETVVQERPDPATAWADAGAIAAAAAAAPAPSPAPAPVETAALDHAFSQALSEALRPSPAPEPEPERAAAPARRRLSLYDEVATEPQPEPAPEAAAEPFVAERPRYEPGPEELEERLQAAERPERRPAKRSAFGLLFGLLGVLGLAVLIGQVLYMKRVEIAAQAPDLRPMLEAACKPFRCTVPLATEEQYIRTEWSELAFVPEHSNLIQLNATLKNHASFVQAYPMLELSLKDADDQVLVRRVLTPAEYLKGDDVHSGQFAPNTEVKLSLRLDVGQLHPSGYSLHWFYP